MKTFSTLPIACAALLLVNAINIDAQTFYRYTDRNGQVVYADRPPFPSDNAKDIQLKQAGGNFVETDKMSAATRRAAARFPVTLYAFSCGEACESAEALLQKRGVPYTYIDTQTEDGDQKLKALTAKTTVPVLRVGDSFLVGFNEESWNSKLNGGGYPQDAGVRTSVMHTKTPTAPEPQAQAGSEQPPETETPAL